MLGLTNTDRLQNLSDEELLVRSRREPWVFSVLLDRYQKPFLRKAKGILSNQQDAEEIVQDTFTKIYLHAHSFESRPDASFSSWGYKILMNTAFTRYQKCIKHGQRFTNIDPDFEQLYGERELHSAFSGKRDAIDRILEMLPGHFARVLHLHYLERWSHRDIAEHTGETVGTIKARLHRARAAFKEKASGSEMELLE